MASLVFVVGFAYLIHRPLVQLYQNFQARIQTPGTGPNRLFGGSITPTITKWLSAQQQQTGASLLLLPDLERLHNKGNGAVHCLNITETNVCQQQQLCLAIMPTAVLCASAEEQIRSQMLKANSSSGGGGQQSTAGADASALLSDKLHSDTVMAGGVTVVEKPLGVAKATADKAATAAAAAVDAVGTAAADVAKAAGGGRCGRRCRCCSGSAGREGRLPADEVDRQRSRL